MLCSFKTWLKIKTGARLLMRTVLWLELPKGVGLKLDGDGYRFWFKLVKDVSCVVRRINLFEDLGMSHGGERVLAALFDLFKEVWTKPDMDAVFWRRYSDAMLTTSCLVDLWTALRVFWFAFEFSMDVSSCNTVCVSLSGFWLQFVCQKLINGGYNRWSYNCTYFMRIQFIYQT